MPEFAEIIKTFRPFFYKIGRAYTDNQTDFEDLMQEMYGQVWHSLPNFKQQSTLSTWVYRVCLNTALTFNRSEKRRRAQQKEWQNIPRFTAEDFAESMQHFERLDQGVWLLIESLKELNEIDRALVIFHLEKLPYQEIAEELGISASNVGVRLNRIKKKLYKILKSKGYEY